MKELCKHPNGYYITIDGEIVTDAGNDGIIHRRKIADRTRRSLVAKYPDKKIELVGAFTY